MPHISVLTMQLILGIVPDESEEEVDQPEEQGEVESKKPKIEPRATLPGVDELLDSESHVPGYLDSGGHYTVGCSHLGRIRGQSDAGCCSK